jgi:uroporphyrinogen decarboxylase
MAMAMAEAKKVSQLTPREKFIAALERRPLPGRVPHFELVFFLTMEAFGELHPTHRIFHQWGQMSENERRLHRESIAALYIKTAEKYEHDAIFVHSDRNDFDETARLLDEIRRQSGDRYFLMLHGDPTLAIPDGKGMTELSVRMAEEPEAVLRDCRQRIDDDVALAQKYKRHGCLDGYALCSDYCFNSGSFMSPRMFERFVAPQLIQIVTAYRELGFYVIKHTDGNIMPILHHLLAAKPHALHSLDPQGGVDMAEMVRVAGDQVCLIGNVNCGLMQTGTDEEVIASARYALQNGMQAPGYIFSTSNCVFTGMDLARYDLIQDVWRREGIRPE